MDGEKTRELKQRADERVCRAFPQLQDPPEYHKEVVSPEPFMLYRHIIPLDAEAYPGIVFLGHIVVGNNFRAAECQALWAAAYLERRMTIPRRAELEEDVILKLAGCRRRYLSKGRSGHWLYYDLIPYTDTLLEDLGLTSHLTGKMRDLCMTCVADDSKGILDEYSKVHGKDSLSKG